MSNFDRKDHWENIYKSKRFPEVSWYQEEPRTSLEFFSQFNLPKEAKIIDIGGGESYFVDHLLARGYQDISVLDISRDALDRTRKRLGLRGTKVKWIVADAARFKPVEKYDFWHDRATFHFLTSDEEIESYIQTAQKHINPNGILIVGTFSENGPKKCSGIEIRQYSEETMTDRLKRSFEKLRCIRVDHRTPFDTIQNFLFCSFRKVASPTG
jgi:SAM-dependent methyltransferase